MQVTVEERQDTLSQRRELVTITVTEEDFLRLKASGGLWQDQLGVALRRYLHIKETPRRRVQTNTHGWTRGPVVSFPAAIPKVITDRIRNLGGRFDNHTIEAVRVFFLGKVDASHIIPQENGSRFRLHSSTGSTALSALGLFVARVFGHPLLP
jgi:hypothetical protein